MIKHFVIAAALAVSPLAMPQNASADHCSYRGYYRGYRPVAPVVRYRPAPIYSPYYGGYRGIPGYRTPYGVGYGSIYNRGFGYGYGGWGGPYYGRGTSIGIGRGGVFMNFGL